jgi:hypothetical protein
MLMIGVIGLIHPIKLTNLFFPLSRGGVHGAISNSFYWRSRDGILDKRDAVVLILVYATSLELQASIAALAA